MSPRCTLLALAVAAACAFVVTCSGGSGRDPRYPRRPPGCELAIYHELPSGGWDDIGFVEVGCYLDESEIACLGRLRTEACRMGGDIVYNVPRRALRPVERGMIYRAMVAHTRIAKKQDDGPVPDAGSGPVVPLPMAPAAPAPGAGDGGSTAADAARQ